jgi:hypothetical protein
MSETLLRLIPVDPRHVPPPETHQPALALLEQLVPGEETEVRVYEKLEYMDPGEWIEAVICPRCGTRLVMDWSPEHTPYFEWYCDVVHQADQLGAESTQVVMPCCQANLPFAALRFEDAGFARFQLAIWNPDIDCPMPAEHQGQLEAVLGCGLRQVWGRY